VSEKKPKTSGGFLRFLKVFFTQRPSKEAVELAESYAALEREYAKVESAVREGEIKAAGGDYILLLQSIQSAHPWGSPEYERIQKEIDKTLADIS